MDPIIKDDGRFKYLEIGDGPVLVLLHGLFGALSNFEGLVKYFSKRFKVVVPLLPIFEMPIKEVSLGGLLKYIKEFVSYKGYENVHVLGNSLGGHIALLYTLDSPERVKSVTLTGSSGLFENSLGRTFPKRGDYQFIKKKTEDTFYDPKVATKALVDEVFDIVNDRNKALRVLYTARSALRHNVRERLSKIKVPTLLIWGKQDTVTPPFVGEEFNKHIENSELVLIDKCGHAPMMEDPNAFNEALEKFLEKVATTPDKEPVNPA
ncbi:MAG: alpha/beta hydrolase [Bacteroidota bacterium]